MGRYYEISISPKPASATAALSPTHVYSSYPGGIYDPGALNIQMDVFASVMAVPLGNSTITIDGVPISDILQAKQFAGMQIAVKGGMGAGLPLVKPWQAGLLVQGSIFQAFTNWVGTDMNINFVIVPSTYTFQSAGNFVFNWVSGQSLESALSNMLAVAYPNSTIVIDIGSQYSTSAPVYHIANTLGLMSRFIKRHTQSSDSPGVDIMVLPSGTIFASDGSELPPPIFIEFTDFIGQPKWVDVQTMQFVTVMRADIQVGSIVKMPVGLPNAPGIVQTGAASLPSSLKYRTSFQGQFVIQQVRHIGNFRDADGASWATVFQAAAINV